MNLQYLSSVWGSVAPAVADHLWQSTVFAALAGLLTLLLRKEHARVRYWMWMAASLKFLLPFALLIGLGSLFTLPDFHSRRQAATYVAIEQVSQPFAHPASTLAPAATSSDATPTFNHLIPALLVAIWLIGFLIVLVTWCIRWRRISKVLCSACPLVEGKQVEALRRLERLAGVRNSIPLLLSSACLEPGVFGFIRPVLVLPEGICERLNDRHLEAILAHEVWHVRRRDNLAAALHMLIQALFWFHPLVWWLGGRLVEERERACDEQVLQMGSAPHIYAESILKTCEFCVESPLACASGITGADLKKRIVRIMTGDTRHELSRRKKLLLGVTGFLVLAVPLGIGLAHGKMAQENGSRSEALSQTEHADASTTKFEVASIKQDKSGARGVQFMLRPGRFTATNIPIRMVIKFAYSLQSNDQLTGGPGWINSDKYDIEGKEFDSFAESMKGRPLEEVAEHIRRMVQSMLADRFNLKVHQETKELPVYALVVANHGPKLTESKLPPPSPMGGSPAARRGPGGGEGFRMMGLGHLEGRAVTIHFLADVLTQQLGRLVVDDTGLKGQYAFTLNWTPDQEERAIFMQAGGGNPGMDRPGPVKPSGPSIFTAVQEQLGLKLKAERKPVEVLVIDHIDRPSPN